MYEINPYLPVEEEGVQLGLEERLDSTLPGRWYLVGGSIQYTSWGRLPVEEEGVELGLEERLDLLKHRTATALDDHQHDRVGGLVTRLSAKVVAAATVMLWTGRQSHHVLPASEFTDEHTCLPPLPIPVGGRRHPSTLLNSYACSPIPL